MIHEDIHDILKDIAKEEAELIDFDKHIEGLPLDAGTQWSPDYYNREGAKKARELLDKVKKDINEIIQKRAAALANSQYASVREAVKNVTLCQPEAGAGAGV